MKRYIGFGLHLLVTLILLCFFSVPARSQLSGSYTIGQGGVYSNFDAAVSDLLAQGVNGPVTFNIFSGTYEPSDPTKAIIYIDVLIPGVSETNRVTFMPDAGSGGNVDNVILERTQGSAGVGDGTFIELRTGYVTIRNLTLNYADISTTARVNSAINIRRVPLLNLELEGIEIIGCKINGKSSTSRIFAGIRFWHANLNAIVKDNIINGAHNGIYFPEQTFLTRDAIIEGNKISGTKSWVTGASEERGEGILLGPGENVILKSNEIDYSGGASGRRGIHVVNAVNITIDGNIVKNVSTGGGVSPNDGFFGIWLFSSDGGIVSNNMVAGIRTGNRTSISILADNILVAHNSIYQQPSNGGPFSATTALRIDGTNNQVFNNIIIDKTSSGTNVQVMFVVDTTGNSFDYNNIVSGGIRFVRANNQNYNTLEEWQATGYGLHSISNEPAFIDKNRDLHLTDCSIYDDDIRGTYLPEVPRDFDDELRDQTSPFMGADETDGELPELFSSPFKYESGNQSWQFTSADLDGDTDIDIAVSNISSDDITIIWNDGTGVFSSPPDHFFFGNDPYSVKAGLLNNDNLYDLIVTTGDSAFIRFNSGGGNFSAPFAIPPIAFLPIFTDAFIVDLAVGDFDNDNDDDILISNHVVGFPPPALMFPLLNNGNGSFTLDLGDLFDAGDFIDQVVLSDLNGDDFLDAIMVDAITNNKVYISMNLGLDGGNNWLGFDDNEIELPEFVGSVPPSSTIIVDDFDNTNGNDIIIRDAFSIDTLIYYHNDGNGNFSYTKLPTHPNRTPRVFVSMDYNKDGYPDIVSANHTEDLHVLLNDGTGNFNLIQLCDISSFGAFPDAIVTADFTGDNMPDIAVLSGNDTINIYENLGWTPTGIETESNDIVVKDYDLFQNYPNPFNPTTTIRFSLPQSGFVSLKVYDILGREVGSLVNEYKKLGSHEVELITGSLASGVYFYRLRAGSFAETKKLLLLK